MPNIDAVMQPATRSSIKKTKNIKHVICHRNSRICFILTEDKTIVVISSGAFLLEPVVVPGDLWRRRLNRIRGLVVQRKISTYDQLLKYCRPGVEFTQVKVDWYV